MLKTTLTLALLECTLVVRPVLKSCQVCCETDSIQACRFVKNCSEGIEPKSPDLETETSKEDAKS